MEMNFRAAEGKLIVKLKETRETTKSGIMLSQNQVSDVFEGEVVSHGKSVQDISDGDIIVFSRNKGYRLPKSGDDYVIIESEDILGIHKN